MEKTLPPTRRTFLLGSAALVAATRVPGFVATPVMAADSASALAADPRRPQYHCLPTAHWMNDPNGPIYWKGNYHLFYQFNPNGTDMGVFKGGMYWGHAISRDMIHWQHLPVALSPTHGSADQQGCWTGTVIPHGNSVAALYTGVVFDQQQPTTRDGANSLRETQCLALSDDPELKIWTKRAQPVIAAPPAGMQVTGFRDPSPWRQGAWYYTTVGTGLQNAAHQPDGAILLYRSKDLIHWEYLHLLTSMQAIAASGSQATATGDMWECPEFFQLNGKHVLIYSTGGRSYWLSGVLDTNRMIFHPTRSGVLDYGAYYSAKTQLDQQRRRIIWGWIKESRSDEESAQAGWAGMFSLPRVLTLDMDGELQIAVADDVNVLRRRQQTFAPFPDEVRNQQRLRELVIDEASGEVLCILRRPTVPTVFTLVSAKEAEEKDKTETPLIQVHYDPATPGQLHVDDQTIPIAADGELQLHMYVDGSVVEFFANSRSAYTKRFYYSGTKAPKISPRFTGKWADIQTLKVWQIAPISSDRLTT